MIVVGLLSIIFGIILAIWTFIQKGSDILTVSADTLQRLKEYVFVEFADRWAQSPDDPAYMSFGQYAGYIKTGDTVTILDKNTLNVEGMTDSVSKGLLIFSVVLIVVGILCVIGYFAFDRKRKGVVRATAVQRFKDSMRMFIIGIVMAVVGLGMSIYAWIQSSSFTYALQQKVGIWNKFIDNAVSTNNVDASWASWLKLDTAATLTDFNAGSPLPLTLISICSIVGIILLIVGASLAVSCVGRACKTKLYPVFNGLLLIIMTLIILVPMYKTIIDSIDALAGNGVYLLPQKFTMRAYKDIVTQTDMYRPFLISVLTTVVGTLFGLTLSTLGAYVLIQFEMPGRNFFAYMLLFTMIFSGGMIPLFLVMKNLHLTNTLWSVILPLSMNVYNLVLMRNFFEGIPGSLFEAAKIDGCSPIQIFIKVVLPLSKAAIASIGLMFAVTFWNDYTNFKLYITENKLFNFQMKLRSFADETVSMNEYYATETIQSASVIVAILPFLILYPFCQNYFVQGVNVGAVKE